MPFPRKRKALRFTEEERHKLESISRSRTEEKRRTLRASILLDSLSGQSDEAIARQHRVSRGTVLLCIGKCLEFGLDAALVSAAAEKGTSSAVEREPGVGLRSGLRCHLFLVGVHASVLEESGSGSERIALRKVRRVAAV